ncbi:MAG: TraR/DksA family transcriptional regulator [Proteobacteria bacterium]|nr:TraR/DksA family transcriptional regulator [Pseudomonadota bacterium]NOG60795.1 TraR/DksA family transcriptional regulator [Pseudomonadota bacterium]
MLSGDLDLNHFKILLNEKRDEITELIETGDNATQPVELDQTRVGRLSRMDAMQAQAMSIEAKRRRELELSRIKSALMRIEDASYGECLQCSEMISTARLEHNPSATLCIQCAERNE